MAISWLLSTVTILSLLMTWLLRRYAIARSLMDIPNARSSHSVATPRGGGVAIVLSFLIALPILAVSGGVSWYLTWALLGAGGVTAIVGFLDDHGHIAARWRLLAHFLSAAWILLWLGGAPPITFLGAHLNLGWLGHVLATLYLVWMLNLYNFMDGIDGIASIEAICICLGAFIVQWLSGYHELAMAPLLLAASVLGFLFWNFPPARIFMGDAGSGFLGIVLGGFALYATWTDPGLLWVWLILSGVFIVDATLTLLRRLIRGDKIYEAHRSHAYQYASRKIGGHLPVTLAIAGVNLFWLLPVAVCVGVFGLDGALGLLVGYVPLVLLAVKYRAGELEKKG